MNSGAKALAASETKFDRKAFTILFSVLSLLFGVGLGLAISLVEFTGNSEMYSQLAFSLIPAAVIWTYVLFHYLKRFDD
ncbi:hypothetical protein Q5L94_01470 [Idiomarina sp. Sol25]|uniref:hypothetical protein n=1 Tax=Idiomarina sp. Sol25 TaxID=3064000 RepID=UPI00294B20DB|nr:hypothetical protein [Idiomarina sp. Sol25]MDV6326710.1 hypothetical protein [Idiomarina sp. Sol25]